MRVVVITKDKTDYTSTIDSFLRDFEHQTGHTLEVLDPDSVDGTQFCRTYDIVEYPTIIAISDDGIMQNSWSGLPVPTISELSYYIQ